MANKVVFLAYANSQSHPLPTLTKEDREVFSTLVIEQLKGRFTIHRESYATGESINEFLGKYDEIAVFHYSGHAGEKHLLLSDKQTLATGIAQQLDGSVKNGSLKLVMLNGCSTAGQVKNLLELGVPAVIATSAPVRDDTATAFAIRFYQNLVERDMDILNAFQDALGAAQNMTDRDLDIRNKMPRGMDFLDDKKLDAPLWEIFCKEEAALTINPLPTLLIRTTSTYQVNKELRETLWTAFSKADEINELQQKEAKGNFVETADKHDAILKVIPFPIGVQLKKLFMPLPGVNEGFDKISRRRIEQICTVFHTTMEFIGYIMLSQLWEEKLQREEKYENAKKTQVEKQLPVEAVLDDRIKQLPDDLLKVLRQHFSATPEERQHFNYLPFIRGIREFFDSLNNNQGIDYFISELTRLKELFQQETPTKFEQACIYFTDLQNQLKEARIGDGAIAVICEESERKLCHFFSELGFLQEYKLTSVQSIYISKFRHKRKAQFNHSVVRLMRATGGSDKFLYRWNSFIDNPGVVLLKGDINLIDRETKQFEVKDNFQFLNLSPFLLDSFAFEKDESSQTTPMIYAQYIRGNKTYRFTKVDSSNITRDLIEFGEHSIYNTVWLDLEDYRKNVLMDMQ